MSLKCTSFFCCTDCTVEWQSCLLLPDNWLFGICFPDWKQLRQCPDLKPEAEKGAPCVGSKGLSQLSSSWSTEAHSYPLPQDAQTQPHPLDPPSTCWFSRPWFIFYSFFFTWCFWFWLLSSLVAVKRSNAWTQNKTAAQKSLQNDNSDVTVRWV